MTQSAAGITSFAFQAQTEESQPISGTIDAPDIQSATSRLEGLRLHVLDLTPTSRPVRAKRLSTEDFLAFNQQLAHLTQVGLPIEQGLRLMAQDIGSGTLGDT